MFFRQSRKLASPFFFLSALFLVVLLVGIASAEEFTPAMIRKVSSAVKLLVTGDGRGNIKGQGTGFFISSDGHMLTNYHVVEGSKEIVIWENKKLYEVSRVVAFNKEADVALLETKYPKSMIHVLPLRNNMIELGESIMVLGYPKALRLGTAITLTKGNVSSIRPVGVNTLVQFTAPIAGGSSGSPIIDKNGKVAGIVTSELTLGQGMFLGLSSPSILKHVARHIPSGGSGRTIAAKPTPTPAPKPQTPTPTPSKAIPLPTTGATALTAAEIREAQGILNELGFNAGSVDGKAGAQTETAVKAFQRNRGVTQDGKLTKAMLEKLRSVKREREKASQAARPAVKPVTPETNLLPRSVTARDGSVLLLVPAGEFEMGDGKDGDNPKHRVHLDAYYIGKYAVTNAQYAKFVRATGHRPPNNTIWDDSKFANHPVVNVSWDDAMAYARWAGCTLPTEAQWEKAARGPKGYVYPWGNSWDPSKLRHGGNRGNGTTASVDAYPGGVSGYGTYQQAGNV
ncbi:MAG: trypsin-like serine protease, partial [Synergistales bacterium]|nr:trypsin-like serine protease [Synergistales bacterium]